MSIRSFHQACGQKLLILYDKYVLLYNRIIFQFVIALNEAVKSKILQKYPTHLINIIVLIYLHIYI